METIGFKLKLPRCLSNLHVNEHQLYNQLVKGFLSKKKKTIVEGFSPK